VLWCRLPHPSSSALATTAAELGVRVTPGSRFAADGTLEGWLRLPFTRPTDELERALPLLAQAWARVRPDDVRERPEDDPVREFVV
jgi:DNA-binding transcriptional MocR family regulator